MNEQVKMNTSNLYREELVTDMEHGTIKVYHPIRKWNDEMVDDPSRTKIFVATGMLRTPHGNMPIEVPIADAADLFDAIDKSAAATEAAVQDMIKKFQELEREQRNKIITPAEAMGKTLHH